MSDVRLLAAFALACGGCIDLLAPGELGELRMFGDVVGEPPPVTSPIADLDGNIYVLSGARDLPEVTARVARRGGGWVGGCRVQKGLDRGAHGWVGADQSRGWYWAGDALVEVVGDTGSCRAVLDTDPATAADLAMLGVIPDVRVTPGRSTIAVLVTSPSDAVPFFAGIDLDLGVYAHLERFEPGNAEDVVVLGTGAAADRDGDGFMLLRYRVGEAVRVEARHVTHDGGVAAIAPIATGLEEEGEDAILGFLQGHWDGDVAGVTASGALLTFGPTGGRIRETGGLAAAGVLRDGDDLWLVGTKSGRSAVARILPGGALEPAQSWTGSDELAASLRDGVIIRDDRSQPIRHPRWANPRAALGPAPFVQAESPYPYADGESLLLVAGPSYTSGGRVFTSIAVGAVGLSVP